MTEHKSALILVVEDESALMRALRDKLSIEGLVVQEATNGEEGLRAALEKHPDIILLDVVMPKMDGLEMAKKLREDKWEAQVPIIILSNFSEVDKVQKALENGIFEYFVKSDTTLDHIVERVKELLA